MIQHNPNDHRIEDIDDAAEKLRIKKEKNAASAKKTRDRKKAYVNELEQRLQKQEAKIAKLIQSEIKAHMSGDSTSDMTNFITYWKTWSSTFDNLISTLHRQIWSNNSHEHIEQIIKNFY
ncbi:uncharacterized protein [Rutidosis leptorrhynchoides]|uniref:uncharacterized protein isoform X3 n=1 Tax=Rutidosis leptorrhynchoides TaxID=125765 RepID=UPI003A9944E7